ncbi:MAG: orotidine-5'-phosphate decarboxylase [Chlorobi bacterium]|nr:orotidine-5'-phosphate decarboxylase [Chlorobiota bacterium]
MTRQHLISEIKRKKSFLCIGLDTDIAKIPKFLLRFSDPVFEFNKQIIDSTHDLCIAYKPNTAFYESNGAEGWLSLEKTIHYIKNKYPEIFVIADAKRGDIGNTSKMYAKAFFEKLNADALTVAPYMGSDSILPFFNYPKKWLILLALTSNIGANDFQLSSNNLKNKLFEDVIIKSKKWGNRDNLMFVIGATKAEILQQIRQIVPDYFLLIPGIGAQGGSLQKVVQYGITKDCGLIVNSSRSIIYAGDMSNKFSKSSRLKALEIQQEMKELLFLNKF